MGVAINTLADMEALFDGIPLDQVSTSMTINAPAAVLLAMYVALAEKQGIDPATLRGTIQNDILKEYIARGTYIFPPGPSLRLIENTFEYCSHYLPHWNMISISGYHIREAGATAVQELAFTLADAICYIETALKAGLHIDDFAPRLAFFFASRSSANIVRNCNAFVSRSTSPTPFFDREAGGCIATCSQRGRRRCRNDHLQSRIQSVMRFAKPSIEELISALDEMKAAGARSVILRAHPGSAGLVGRPRCLRAAGARAAIHWPMTTLSAASCVPSSRSPFRSSRMIEGSVWGGACELAITCDLVIATPVPRSRSHPPGSACRTTPRASST